MDDDDRCFYIGWLCACVNVRVALSKQRDCCGDQYIMRSVRHRRCSQINYLLKELKNSWSPSMLGTQ